ncbi:unnamed protein product, partial [Ectocarpus sp. 4 AP-2014]
MRFEVKDGDFTQLGNRCQLFYRARKDPFSSTSCRDDWPPPASRPSRFAQTYHGR